MGKNNYKFKEELLKIAKEDPRFFEDLLPNRFLRNPFPPSEAGDRLVVHPSATISPDAHIEFVEGWKRGGLPLNPDEKITIGARCSVDAFVWLRSYGHGITMGDDCTIHHYSIIQGPVTLGDGVRIGPHTVFHASEHIFSARDIPIYKQGVTSKGITVGSNVYIGANVTILDGVVIGEGSVLAAGAVITKNVPPYTIAGGVPARIIRERN
jgi:acetyltransferase-like isoleucine patch superfamily enzyme